MGSIVQELNTSNLPTGYLYAVGNFSDYNGVTIPKGFARLSATGSLEASFNSGQSGVDNLQNEMYGLGLHRNQSGIITGNILIGGDLTGYNSGVSMGILRTFSNGVLDEFFQGPGN